MKANRLAKSVRIALAFGASSTLLLSGAAFAQAEDEQEEEEAERAERITVVGSRIRTDGLDSATPIEIISAELATEQGLSTLGELLRTTTIAAGSDQLISAYSVGFVTAGGAGNESISMRGLGANRTLVLLNGRRAGPAGTRGQVAAYDMNSLPVAAIERVEILKDGASSLYGSDAVAGVINIITKKGDGASVNFSGSKPMDSGGETYRLNGTYGESFDNGSYRIVLDHNVNTGLQRSDRDYFACNERYFFDPESGERADPIDPRTGEFHCNGTGYGLYRGFGGGRLLFDETGYGFPQAGTDAYDDDFVNGAPAGWYWAGWDKESDGWLNGQHPFFRTQSMIPETSTTAAFIQGDYDLGDSMSLYGEFLHSSRETEIYSARQFWTADIGYVPLSLAEGWSGSELVLPVAITDHYGNTTTVDYTRGVIGLEGSIGFWNWDMSYQRSYNKGEYAQKVILRDSMIMAQLNLIGAGPCEGEQSPLSGRDCVPVDWFSWDHMNGNPGADVKAFLFGDEVGNTIYKQDTFDAYITGDILDLPSGPLATAVGVYYQTDELKDTPGVETLRGNSWGLSGAGITAGKSKTKAVYGELSAPVLRDLPFVEALDVTGSARWTDVDAYGSDTTFKVSMNWSIGGGLRARASRGTSFRAPALFELYLDNQTGFLGQNIDPCINWVESENPLIRENCAAAGVPESYIAGIGSSMTAVTGGGAGQLQAETSVSEGFGFIWESPERMWAASVDYYKVTIDDQVSNVGGSNVLNLCYTSENFENEPFCDQITRRDGTDGDYGIDTVRGGYVNVAQQLVRGVDIVTTFNAETPIGQLRSTLNHTIQIERVFQQFPDSDPISYIGRISNPKHIGTLNTSLMTNDWTFTWNARYVDKTSNYYLYTNGNELQYRGETVNFIADTPTYVIHALSAQTRLFDGLDVTFGLANIFDKEPPKAGPSAVAVAGNTIYASQYDYYGRRAFVNLSYQF